jgi:hypothetical protein
VTDLQPLDLISDSATGKVRTLFSQIDFLYLQPVFQIMPANII